MKTCFHIFVLFLILRNIASAQTDLDKSSPLNDGITSVDYYSGQAGICIPLLNVSLQEFTLPINLMYHTSGIRVDQQASWVGLGWDLQCAGKVDREIKDLPDDYYKINTNEPHEIGWINSYANSCPGFGSYPAENGISALLVHTYPSDNNTESEEWRSIKLYNLFGVNSNVRSDLEPDMFHFYGPGISGSFVFDHTGNPKLLNCSGYSIHVYTDNANSLQKFEITDTKGNIFYFTEREMINSSSEIISVQTPPVTSNSQRPIKIPMASSEFLPFNHYAQTHPENYQQQTAIKMIAGQALSISNPVFTSFTRSWCLTKIRTWLGKEIIFEYVTERQHLDERNYTCVNNTTANGNENIMVHVVLNSNELCDVYEKPKRLVRIYSPGQFELNFISFNARGDVNTKGVIPENIPPNQNPNLPCPSVPESPPARLDLIKYYILNESPGNNTLVKTIQFNYDYFTSLSLPQNIYTANSPIGSTVRLKLLSVQEINELSGDKFNPWQFQYYTGDLPPRFSFAQDYWGYFNGNSSSSTLIPQLFVYPELEEDVRFRLSPIESAVTNGKTQYTLPGADRSMNFNYAIRGSLRKVFFPSGKAEEYLLESNNYEDYSDFGNNETYTHVIAGAGIRLKSRIISSSGNVAYIENIEYTPSRPVALPIFGYFDHQVFLCNNQVYDQEYVNSYYQRTGYNMAPLNDGLIGYIKAIVKKIDNNNNVKFGLTEYIFYHNATIDDETSEDGLFMRTPINFCREYYDIYSNSYIDPLLSFSAKDYPFPPAVNYSFSRGLIKDIINKNSEGVVINKTSFEYQNVFLNGSGTEDVFGLNTGLLTYNNYGSTCHTQCNQSQTDCGLFEPLNVYSKYKIITGVEKRPSSIVYKKFKMDGTEGSVVTTNYEYNGNGQVSEENFFNADGVQLITRYRYPQDFREGVVPIYPLDEEARGIHSLAGINRLFAPIETVSFIKKPGDDSEFVTGGTLSTFRFYPKNPSEIGPLPSKTYLLNLDSPIEFGNPNNPYSFATTKIELINNELVLVKNQNYKLISVVDDYDENRNIIQQHFVNDLYHSSIYGYNGSSLVAQADNCQFAEFAYTGFESEELLGWSSSGTIIQDQSCYSGLYMLELINTGSGGNNGWGPMKVIPLIYEPPVAGYQASVWVKGSSDAYLHIEIDGDWSSHQRTYNSGDPDEWHLLTVRLLKEQVESIWNIPTKSIRVYIGNESSTEYSYFDELRAHPEDASLQTFSGAASLGLLSSLNSNNQISKTNLDGLGRVISTCDQDGNIIEYNEYNFTNPADFTWSPIEPKPAGTPLRFVSACKTADNYVVDFGDGSAPYTGTAFPCFHTYSQGANVYSVTLTCIVNGVQYSKTNNVTVQ